MARKEKTTEEQSKLKAGQIRFYDNFLPKLGAGRYSVEVQQSLEGDGVEPQTFERHQKFIVSGPRFVLPEQEIHSVFPSPGIQAHYEGVLPQIVFRKRNLPWERKVYDKGNTYPTPWVTLLLFEEEEILTGKASADRQLRTKAVSRKSTALFEKEDLPSNYLPPQMEASPETDEPNCYTIDLKKETFLQLAPRLEELPFLSHVREVNTDGKEFLGMHADGWFGLSLGNRLPKTPPEIEPGSQAALEGHNFARNIVHLVSLEGFTGYLANKPEGVYQQNLANTSYEYVRLASLASWEFYAKPPSERFEKIMDQLGTEMLRVSDVANVQNEGVKTALEGGYVPLQYHSRIGEQTMAWYRGPLLPQIEPRGGIEDDTFFSAEAGLIFDKDNGLFDASYATAWQIGRLLALSDTHFSESLLNWKRNATRKINEFLERQKIQTSDTDLTTPNSFDPESIKKFLDPDFAINTFFEGFLDQIKQAEEKFDRNLRPDAQITEELKDFPGIISEENYQELLRLGKEIQQALLNELLNPNTTV